MSCWAAACTRRAIWPMSSPVTRATGPATEIAARATPSRSSTGAATEDRPGSSSSTLNAYPRARVSARQRRNCSLLRIVRGRADREARRAQAASATAGLKAATALPELVRWMGRTRDDAGREPEAVIALEALDVEHLPAFGHGQVHGLARLIAQRLEQRQSVIS